MSSTCTDQDHSFYLAIRQFRHDHFQKQKILLFLRHTDTGMLQHGLQTTICTNNNKKDNNAINVSHSSERNHIQSQNINRKLTLTQFIYP